MINSFNNNIYYFKDSKDNLGSVRSPPTAPSEHSNGVKNDIMSRKSRSNFFKKIQVNIMYSNSI